MAKQDTDRDPASRVIQAVIDRHDSDTIRQPKISDEFSLNQGRVFTVEYVDQTGSAFFNYVHCAGDDCRVFTRSRELVQFIARSQQSTASRILQVVGVSGIIAVLITLTICYLALRGTQIPDILSNAVTTILGFYFATSVYEATRSRN